MFDNVLIPTDGSEQAERAVDTGLDLAERFGSDVHVLYVVETEATYILTVGLSDEEMEEYEEYGEEVVNEVVDRATARGLDARGVVRKGKISEQIAEYAEENGLDHIVMGERGRGSIEKYLGSTAEKLLRMAPAPVTVVPSNGR
jgi:nucleotide-binding universal stress UspA family protein